MAKINLTALTANADAQGPVVTAVEGAVARALAGGVTAAEQAEIDRVAGVIAANNLKLAAVAESVPPDPPPNP